MGNSDYVKFVLSEMLNIEQDKVNRFLQIMKGNIIYFNSKQIEKEEIMKEYHKLKDNFSERDIVEILAKRFERSKRTIKRIIYENTHKEQC